VTVELELPPGPAFDTVSRLVLGGLGARVGLGINRITDFQQALHATFQQPPSRSTLVVTMKPTAEDLQVTLGPFDRAATPSPGVMGVVSALVDEIATHESGDDVWVDMRVTRRRQTPPAG
jgi:hypothetical protein